MTLAGWRLDPAVWLGTATLAGTYAAGLRARRARAMRPWPWGRSAFFAAGLAVALIAIVSPLDADGDAAFAPHMVQHLLLTELVAPLLLLGAPLPLLLAALSPARARTVVRLLRGRAVRFATFPAVTWAVFVGSLWLAHVGPLFELALDDERVHALEHVVFLATATLFWLPIVALPPTPWTDGALAYPLRMLYVLVAMPAEAFLGFALYGAPRVIYPHYLAAGLADQRAAGELMWIGSGLAMFVAFLLVGAEWGVAERKLGAQRNRALDRAALSRRAPVDAEARSFR